MNTVKKIVLGLIVFLAISSGITKIMLLPQDVDFFGRYGFGNLTLIIFGVVQLVGGVLLVLAKFRLFGAILVGLTFVVSLALLVTDGQYVAALITAVATGLILWVAKSNSDT